MTDLGSGRGTAINASGQVVGGEHSDDPQFLYSDSIRTNLNTLIDPDSGWVLETANSINDNGWITGRGTIGGVGHAFILIPVPEPSNLIIWSVLGALMIWAMLGAMGIGGRWWRRPRLRP